MKKTIAVILSLCMIFNMALAVFAADTAKKYSFKSDISEWKNKNSDVEGWLYIEGTNINYPVIFHAGDNQYYVSRGYDKKPDKNGVIYLESETGSGNQLGMPINTVLYGHNWTNVSANPRIGAASDVMFAQLTAFHHLSFASEHQFINYAGSNGAYVYQVFAAFYTEDSFALEYCRPNLTEDQFNSVLNGARARSLHNFPVDVEYGDHLITLSTCTRAWGPSSRQRFVVMGKRVSAGTKKVSVTAHENYQKPSLPS